MSSRLSKNYYSLYRWLAEFFGVNNTSTSFDNLPYSLSPNVNGQINKFDSSEQMIGMLQALADIRKNVFDIVKPYRSVSQVLSDFLQPVYGLGNILKGVLYLIAFVPLFLFNMIRYAFQCIYSTKRASKRGRSVLLRLMV